MKRMTRFPVLILCLLSVGFFATLEATEKIQSLWSEGGFAVDGNPADWGGKGRILEDEEMMFGVSNDAEYLYLAIFISQQQKLAQIFSRGMTVWFDPGGGKKKRFGVRFPLGREGGSGRPQERSQSSGGRGRGGSVESGPASTPEQRQRQPQTASDMVAAMRELEIIGPEKKQTHQAPLEDVKDVTLRASWQGEGLFYELRIPLARSEEHPYGIAVRPDKPVGIGIETPRTERAPSIGGMTGSTGTRSNNSGVPQSAGAMSSRVTPKAMRVWVKVELARPVTDSSR